MRWLWVLHSNTPPRRARVCSSPPDGIENTASEATEHAFTPQGNLINSTSLQFALQEFRTFHHGVDAAVLKPTSCTQ